MLRRVCRGIRIALGALPLLVLALPPSPARADEPAPDPLVLSPVVVTPTRTEESSFEIPASIDVVRPDPRRGPQVLVSEELRAVPGTTVQSRGTLAQEEQIVVRGFGARSQFGTRGIRLYSDYIPTSTPDGQGSSAVFDLASTERIEVLRGAFSALYGNYSGGVVQAFTRDGTERPTLSSRVLLGSNASTLVGLLFSGSAGPTDYVASLSRFSTDGWRDRSAAIKEQFNGKVNLELAPGSTLSLVFNWLGQPRGLDPGGLTAEQAAATPAAASANATAFKTRRTLDNEQGGLVLRQRLGPSDQLLVVGYLGARSNEQFLGVPLEAQNAVTSSGGVSGFDRFSWGARGWWTGERKLAGGPLVVTAGGEYERARENRKGWLNNRGVIAPVPGVAGVLKRDELDVTDGWGLFAQGEWTFVHDLSLTLGLRYTHVGFDSDDRFVCTPQTNTTGTPPGTCSGSSLAVTGTRQNPDDSGSVGHAAWTPVVGLLYRLSSSVHLYANVGRSFETPTIAELAYRSDGAAGLNFRLRPSTSWQYELGSKVLLGRDARMELALFHIDTADELVVATSAGGRSTYRNVPGTRRSGAELSLQARPGAGFGGRLSATYLDARFDEDFPTAGAGGVVKAGNAIPGVPTYAVDAQVSWDHAPTGFTALAEAFGQGPIQVDDLNTEAAHAYGTLAISAGFHQRFGGLRLLEFARCDNLLDASYVSAIAVNATNGQFYYPGAPRTFLAGVTASLEF
jgi:iron complex outermembrane receptor protein